eukprot:123641-Chlamydomonas_euryale.AAC.1
MLGKAGFAAEGWTWSVTFGRLIVRMAGWTGVSSGVLARERVPGEGPSCARPWPDGWGNDVCAAGCGM